MTSINKSYGLRDEADPEPGGAGPDAAVPSAGRLAGVVVVFDDPVGLLGVEVLHGWQHCPGEVLSSFHHPL